MVISSRRCRSDVADVYAVELHIASRLRLFRLMAGISLEDLGKRVGTSTQQVGQYEQGKDRLSASRLYDFAIALAVPIESFFDGLDHQGAKADLPDGALRLSAYLPATKETIALVQSYHAIEDAALRACVIDTVRRIAALSIVADAKAATRT